jgi:transposase
MNPYSLDLRTCSAAASQQPRAKKVPIARYFGVSHSFVKDLVRRQRRTLTQTSHAWARPLS